MIRYILLALYLVVSILVFTNGLTKKLSKKCRLGLSIATLVCDIVIVNLRIIIIPSMTLSGEKLTTHLVFTGLWILVVVFYAFNVGQDTFFLTDTSDETEAEQKEKE